MGELDSFTFDLPVRLRFGAGVMDEIAKAELPGKRLMLAAGGRTIRSNGTLDRLIKMVQKKAEELIIFDDVSPNPTLDSVMKGAETARENRIDCVLGLGGGSALDTAKGIAAMAVNSGNLWDYTASGSGAGKTLAVKPLPVIAVPTTAGTGSEGNKTAVITDTERGEKIGIRTDFPYASYVDPELTLSVPPRHTAEQGFDAFCHCMEAFISVKANPFSDIYALAGMKAVYNWLPSAVENGNDIEARYHVSFGSALGGMVIYLSSCTTAHTIEHMLSGLDSSISHGGGLAMIFDDFHRHIAENVPQRYAQIADALGIGTQGETAAKRADELIDTLREWKTHIGLDGLRLRDHGFTPDQADEMVRLTHWVGGGPLTRDRHRLSDDEIRDILIRSMER